MGNDLSAGQMPSFKKAWASIDKVDLIGRAVGSTIGATLGSLLLPGIGTMIGGMIGNFIGGKVVELIRGKDSTNKVTGIRYGVGPGGMSINVGPGSADSSSATDTVLNKDSSAVLPDKDSALSGDNGSTKSSKDKMIAAYKTYAQLLSEGKGETTEGQQALQEYKQAFNEYEASMSKSGSSDSKSKSQK